MGKHNWHIVPFLESAYFKKRYVLSNSQLQLQLLSHSKPIIITQKFIINYISIKLQLQLLQPWCQGCSASHKAIFECGCNEVRIIKVCGKHNNFYLFSVYWNPEADDGIFDCLLVSMAAIQENDRKASFVFIGDFNAHHKGGFSMCWTVGKSYRFLSLAAPILVPLTIVLLPSPLFLSKVFECLLAKRLNNFAEKKNLFPHLQFGFRKGFGTFDALLTITNFVQKALDCGCKVCMVGLDFSATFNCVNHKALIFKLRQLGVVALFLVS